MDSRKLFLAALLSLGVLVLWQWLFPPKPPVRRLDAPALLSEQAPATGAEPAAAGVSSSSDGGPPASAVSEPEARAEKAVGPAEERPLRAAEREEEVRFENRRYVAVLSNRGATLESFRLRQQEGASGEEGVELVRARNAEQARLFALVDQQAQPLPVDGALFEIERPAADEVAFHYSGPLGVAEKRFHFGDELMEVSIRYQGGSPDWYLLLGPGLRNPVFSELDDRFLKRFRQVSLGAGSEVESRDVTKITEPWTLPLANARWVALEDKYFVAALAPSGPLAAALAVPVLDVRGDDGRVAGFDEVRGELADADKDRPRDLALLVQPAGPELAGQLYLGSKEYPELRALVRDQGFPAGLEKTVRWGTFGFISKPLLYGLRWLHQNVVHNYGWCIVLMTVLIKIVLFPLTHKSYVSMQKMQKLNPRMEAIRHRYRPKLRDKNGRPNLEMQRRMNEEIQGLFREEGVSPAGGCLPLVLQMPIFFGFYQLLAHAVELYSQPWVLWVHDLTAKDPWYVLPLVMGATQFASSKMMPAPSNPSQRILMTTMPIWFTVFALGFPSGLVLYWLTNNLLTIVQQAGYNRLKKAGLLGGEGDEAAAAAGARARKAEGR